MAGSFDIIHAGYATMFEECGDNCDELVVALHNDPSLENGKEKPINSLIERTIVLLGISAVDDVYVYNTEEDLYNLLYYIKPNIRFIGDDYKDRADEITGHKMCIENFATELHIIKRNKLWSLTNLKQKLKDRYLK